MRSHWGARGALTTLAILGLAVSLALFFKDSDVARVSLAEPAPQLTTTPSILAYHVPLTTPSSAPEAKVAIVRSTIETAQQHAPDLPPAAPPQREDPRTALRSAASEIPKINTSKAPPEPSKRSSRGFLQERFVVARERAGSNYEIVAVMHIERVYKLLEKIQLAESHGQVAVIYTSIGAAWSSAAEQFAIAANRWGSARRRASDTERFKSEARRLKTRAAGSWERACEAYEVAAQHFERAENFEGAAKAWDKAAELHIRMIANPDPAGG